MAFFTFPSPFTCNFSTKSLKCWKELERMNAANIKISTGNRNHCSEETFNYLTVIQVGLYQRAFKTGLYIPDIITVLEREKILTLIEDNNLDLHGRNCIACHLFCVKPALTKNTLIHYTSFQQKIRKHTFSLHFTYLSKIYVMYFSKIYLKLQLSVLN